MKAVSPLVGSVLLIGITMAIAAILAYWVSTYTSRSLPSFNTTRTMERCRLSNFEIYTCSFNTTSGDIVFTLHNIGHYEIINLTAYVEFVNGSVSPETRLNESLSVGEFKSFVLSASSTGATSTTFSKLIIGTGLCPGLVRESSCTRV